MAMWGASSADAVAAFRARVAAAAADAETPYAVRGTARGFELTVDVHSRPPQTHTYRVELRPDKRVFTLTDVVRVRDRFQRSVSVGRNVYVVTAVRPDGSGRYRFSSADGHRLIRGVAGELGWREEKPAVLRAARVAGVIGAVVALGTLVALAVVFLGRA
ncbi:hypothetical protein [Streptomyces griseosporeus]|uniref:hypothetical protein n=1 Tax=Streptomyces griseosporeus TaxID=1910 RepID=UPI00378D4B0D